MSGIQTLLDTLRSALDADEDVNKEKANMLIEEEIMKKVCHFISYTCWIEFCVLLHSWNFMHWLIFTTLTGVRIKGYKSMVKISP